ncbi:MAG: PAS domain S-box protein [Verrucomicrobia bacterium]|nr:PAS domain S-box protein [Verrucomicrobiota bacterium]
MQAKPSRQQLFVRSLVLMLAYFAGGKLGLFFSDPTTHITLVWPATGIAVAAILRWGWQCWPGVFLGTVLVENSLGHSLLLSSGMAIGNTLAPLLAAQLLRSMRFDEHFTQRRAGLKVLAASALGMVISATGGAMSLWLAGKLPGTALWPAFLRWWMGDSGGVLMLTPFLLTWSLNEWRVIWRRWMELFLLCAGILIVGWMVFFYSSVGGTWRPLVFLTLPLVVWGSLRFRPLGGMTVSLLLSVIATWALRLSLGPFSNFEPSDQAFLLWAFIVTISVTAVLVGSLQAERESDLARLRANEQALEMAQSHARIGNWAHDPQSGTRHWSREMFRLLRRDLATGPAAYEECFALAHPDDRELLDANHKRMLETGGPLEFVLRTNPALGTVRHLNCTVHSVNAGDNGSRQFVGTVQDITERTLAEQLRAEQANVIEMIAQGAPLGRTLEKLLMALEAQAESMLCSILLLEEKGERLHNVAAPGLPEAYNRAIDGVRIGPCVGSCGTAAFRGERVVVEDIQTDPLWADFRNVAAEHGLRACWSTPIFDSHHRVLGTFAVYYLAPLLPSPEHLKLIDSATNTAAICIERHRDITALLQSEQRLRAIIENEPECVKVVARDGTLLEMNPTGLSILQANSIAEARSRPLIEFIAPEHRESFLQLHQQVINGEQGKLAFEIIGLHGRRSWMETHAVPLRNAKGEVHALLAVTRDVTERKHAEAAVQQRLALEERFSKLATTAPGIIYSFRLRNDGSVCMPYASPTIEQISGYRPEELIDDAAKLFKRIHPGDVERIWDSILESAAKLTPWRQEFRVQRPGMEEIWLEGRATPEPESGGSILWHGFLHDITLRKQAEADRQKLVAQLLHSENVERRRIARELHDTTAQHLAATKLNLDRLLHHSTPVNGEQKQILFDSLNLIEQAVQEIRTLTYVLHPPLLDELGLVGALRDYAAGIEKRSGIQISVDTEGYHGRLPHEIELVLFRVIQESLANVLRHSGSATVLIRLERDDVEARLEVQDSGRGLPPENAQPDTKLLRRMGVGIAAMRERLRHVGGKLNIESDAEGVTVLANIPAPLQSETVPIKIVAEELIS